MPLPTRLCSRGPLAARLRAALVALSALSALLLVGCSRDARSLLSVPADGEVLRPLLRLTARLEPSGSGRFTARFTLADAGPVASRRIQYALDPAVEAAPDWQDAPAGGLLLTLARRDAKPYVLLARSFSASGLASPVERIAFTAENVIATATIVSPRPTHELPVSTPPAFTVRWTGADPEAPNGVPTGYLTRLVRADEINPSNPTGVTAAMVQDYFASDLANLRAAWQATPQTEQTLSGLPVTVVQYFAVVPLDTGGGPGATGTTFDLDRNVLQFRPTLDQIGPAITVFNAMFSRTKFAGGLDPTPLFTVPVLAGNPIAFNWSATPNVGFTVNAYRWALDPVDFTDETPRRNANDLSHWSEWSLATTAATVGPFPPADAEKGGHRFAVEAREDLGITSLFVVQIDVVRKARHPRDLLVIDDMYGTTTEKNADGSINYKSPYPMEAEQDSFYFAVGGFPDTLRILAVPHFGSDVSQAGAFAGFDYDTLDYRFWPREDISILSQYRAVAWYTDQASASRDGSKFGSFTPRTALRLINRAARLNDLAVFSQGGGKVWLFGDGATTAIANGYWSRIVFSGAPRLPYTTGADPRQNILIPGDFLYDFCHLRSELNVAGNSQTTLTKDMQLLSAIPYLPEFAGPASDADRTHDPRIGPGAERTALRWSGLPRLTAATYRSASPNPTDRSNSLTWVITQPLSVTEGTGRRTESVLDTLYLCQARAFDPEHLRSPASDGFPNAVAYHGSEHGEVVWFGFPLYRFELEQARQVVRVVMREFGIDPLPASVRQGAGAAEPPASTVAEAQPVEARLR